MFSLYMVLSANNPTVSQEIPIITFIVLHNLHGIYIMPHLLARFSALNINISNNWGMLFFQGMMATGTDISQFAHSSETKYWKTYRTAQYGDILTFILAVYNSELSILKCFISRTSDFLIMCSWLHPPSLQQ